MTTSRLPEITVTCRKRHSFQTRAHGGQGVDCPECRAGGTRVKVWVRKDRPRTARELAEQEAIDAPAPGAAPAVRVSAELAARWDREPLWDGQIRPAAGRDGDTCPDCGGPLQWEPGRTQIFCQPCGNIGLPAAVLAHYERQEQRRGEIAVRGAMPDESAQRAARARLRAQKDTVKRRVESWLDTIADEDSYDRGQYQRQAFELGAMLRGYLPEVTDAADEPTLAAVWLEIEALVTSDQGQALTAEYEQAQSRAEQQYRAGQQREEYARALVEQQERERQEQQEAERAARELAREETQQRKAITSGPARRTSTGVESLALMIHRNQEAKTRLIETQGECAFKHLGQTVASRIYGVPFRNWGGQMNGHAVTDTPQYRACAKHYDAAEAQLNREGYDDLCYWPLPL